MKALKYALGLLVYVVILSPMPNAFFDFEGLNDGQYGKSLAEALQIDRASMLFADAFRSLVFIFVYFSSNLLYLSKTLKKTPFILLVGILILGDMWQ